MQCFSFAEQAVPFLRGVLDEERDPVIHTPEGCDTSIVLGKEFTERLSHAARTFPNMTGFRLGYNGGRSSAWRSRPLTELDRRVGVSVELSMNTIILKPATRTPGRGRRHEQALVRVVTFGGAGGKVRLTSSVHEEEMRGSRVTETYHPFPSMGVKPLCTDAMLQQVNEGVEHLDLFVLMNAGSRFRLERTGALEGAKKYINVSWTGEVLRPLHPAYENRGGVGAFVAA